MNHTIVFLASLADVWHQRGKRIRQLSSKSNSPVVTRATDEQSAIVDIVYALKVNYDDSHMMMATMMLMMVMIMMTMVMVAMMIMVVVMIMMSLMLMAVMMVMIMMSLILMMMMITTMILMSVIIVTMVVVIVVICNAKSLTLCLFKALSFDDTIDTVKQIVRQVTTSKDKSTATQNGLEVHILQFFYHFIQKAALTQLVSSRPAIISLMKEGLQLNQPPALFLLLVILRSYVQRIPLQEDKKAKKELQVSWGRYSTGTITCLSGGGDSQRRQEQLPGKKKNFVG